MREQGAWWWSFPCQLGLILILIFHFLCNAMQALTAVTLNYLHFLTLREGMSRSYSPDLCTSSNGMRGERLSPINLLLRRHRPTVS